jgi:hypothetical protein
MLNISNCRFNTSYSCVSYEALNEDNPSLCEEFKIIFDREACYVNLARTYYGGKNFCGNIKNDIDWYNECISLRAQNTGSIKLCDTINEKAPHYDTWYNKEKCLELVKMYSNK